MSIEETTDGQGHSKDIAHLYDNDIENILLKSQQYESDLIIHVNT